MPIENEELLRLYREMLLIRRFEDRAGFAYTQGKVGGYIHLYIGQEAVGAGFVSVLRPDDAISTSYRDHGHFIAKGGDPKAAMAELFGKSTGRSRGKGGSMHFYDKDLQFYGGTGIVGASLGIAIGVAWAMKYRGGDQLCLNFFGDGAVNTGLFHESLNLASLWDLPVLFVCENNLYAMGTSVERSHAVTDLATRAAAYGIECEQVDGMDLFACRECAERNIAAIRKDSRPRFVEAITYRYRGHGGADPGTYRSREEVEEWRARDPIAQVERYLLEKEIVTTEQMKEIQAEIIPEVDAILAYAESSAPPPPEALTEHVYAP